MCYNKPMKVKLITVGKLKEKYLKDGIAEYVKRAHEPRRRKCVHLYVRPDAGRTAGDPQGEPDGIRRRVPELRHPQRRQSERHLRAGDHALCPCHGEHGRRERSFRIQSAGRTCRGA